MNSNASGRTRNSWDVISETTDPRVPNSSLEAPSSTTEASSASHGVWGRIQMRLPAVFRGGREWLGHDQQEEVHYTTSQVTQAAMDEGAYDVTRPPILVTSKGLRVLRPEEVDTETQTIRLIPSDRFLEKAPPAKAPPVKQPPVPAQRGYGSGASASSSSRPSRGQAALTASKAAGSSTQGISKFGSQAATDRPWHRPGKAPPTMLMRPTGGMMDDQVEFQDSVFWTPQVLDAVQDVVEEEALFYKPVHKS